MSKFKSFFIFLVLSVLSMGGGLSSLSFSEDDFGDSLEDDFEGVDFNHWQDRLLKSKGSKNDVLLEMLGEAAEESDGLTSRILRIHGPSFFYGENPDNKRDFQRLLLNLFKTHDLQKFRSSYKIKDGESDLFIARVFRAVFYLYVADDMGFTYRLRENLKEVLSWDWNEAKASGLLSSIIDSMDELLGPKIVYHIRGRVETIQPVGRIEEVAVVVEWELVEVESSYNPKSDTLEATENVIEKRVDREFLTKAEAQKIEGDYGTKAGLPIDREAALTLFQNLSKTTRIFENPSPRDIGSSNWERLFLFGEISFVRGEMNFAPIPAGTFEMGSPTSESGRNDNEILHHVRITKPFEIMMTEVTQKQWKEVMGGSNPSYFKGEDLPVEQVSWAGVQVFISELNKKRNDGYIYRLPTEAEWEYAARGGTKKVYSFGDNPAFLEEHGWYDGNSGNTTHPVASCPTKEKAKCNRFGLYDMHGNVWEWCSDWYGAYPMDIAFDPNGPATGSEHVTRGGSWDSGAPSSCRSAVRSRYEDNGISRQIGFRLVRIKK